VNPRSTQTRSGESLLLLPRPMHASTIARMRNLGSNYWKLWTASLISNLGDGISLVAYPWLASAITRDPVHIALIGVATRLPWLIFSLPAGVITDRVDRKRTIAAMDALRFLVTLGVAFFVASNVGQLSAIGTLGDGAFTPPANQGFFLAVLYSSALIFGFAEVLRDNAAQTLMPSLVAKEHLEKANGTLWGAEMTANSFIGPPVAGFLIAAAFALPFFVDAATFVVSAILIFSISGSFRAAEATGRKEKASWTADLKEGVRWLWKHPLLRSLAIILGIMNAMLMLSLAVFVLFVQEILGLTAAEFGLLTTAGAVGGIAGSVLASKASDKIGGGKTLTLALIGSGITTAAIGATSAAWVVWLMFAIGSFLGTMWNVITVSLRQSVIPDHLLGRVNSVYRFFAWGMMPIGSVLGGLIVKLVEPAGGRDLALRAPFYFAGVVFLALWIFGRQHLSQESMDKARAAAE
jgi:MFS family permease